MRKTISVAALILALTCFTYAGEMPNGVTQPPPPQPVMTQEPTAGGEVSNVETPDGEPESLTETLLSVLENVLSLF